jgi:DNA-binding NtrC family response regulator
MLRVPHVALLTEDALQANALVERLQECLVLTHITSFLELEKGSENGQFDVLFCDWRFGDSGWKDALERVQARHPDLPVIILSRTGGEREWMEVLDAGAFDLLVPPYSKPPLLAIVEHAAASHMARQWQRETVTGVGRIA